MKIGSYEGGTAAARKRLLGGPLGHRRVDMAVAGTVKVCRAKASALRCGGGFFPVRVMSFVARCTRAVGSVSGLRW